ncbi:hypothetical protein BP6252_07391 [Coleophoma cylindrospora]|uniref:3-beta hydroxysteroid dehydrogenase/isomerase domain-containing protein n=1 Tax=Coleophoma cylindrospora TaxID=1849047 RepID=A0A3D8RHW7_9HELO|nr:hypothetical protein BP6252_07391 [Coleophoma cylindrospora]
MGFSESDVVFVTGGNGHVSQHVIHQLLSISPGPTVRTSVRSNSSAQKLQDVFNSNKLQIILITDITSDEVFDAALETVTHLAHIASPIVINSKDVKSELLDLAIRGTTRILKSALKIKTMKSVVVTGSFAAVFDSMYGWRPYYIYTPEDWFPITYSEAADPALDLTKWPERWRYDIAYCSSKVLAEKAAWGFWKEANPTWQLTFILPTYIVEPYLTGIQSPDNLNYSNGLVWKAVSGNWTGDWVYPYWVDVRDVAKAHLEALQREEASGKRFILATENVKLSQIAEIVREKFPTLRPSDNYYPPEAFPIDTSDSALLGMDRAIPFEQSMVDMISQFQPVASAGNKNPVIALGSACALPMEWTKRNISKELLLRFFVAI